MTAKMNALILHRLGDPLYYRESVKSLEYMLPANNDNINCFVHDSELPLPDYVKKIKFHLILMGPTFLCHRYNQNKFNKILKQYSFIKESEACKIALPQDDYDCAGILDEWMVDWNVDRIYTICPEHWDILYPKSVLRNNIKLGYTGYISNEWIDSWSTVKPHHERTIDVSYRAAKLTANFGSIGQLKWQIAQRFKDALPSNHGFKLDISVNPNDLIPGRHWHDFMENSRFCLVTPSGSSLIDPYNIIRKKVEEFTLSFPDADFTTIEKNCFPGEDKKHIFTSISPRNIEAALSETVQIAIPETYSGFLKPEEHYIPMNPDCSNIDEIIEMMKDLNFVDKVRKNCKEAILSEPRLRSFNFSGELIDFAQSIIENRSLIFEDQYKINSLLARYNEEIKITSDKYWRTKRKMRRVKSLLLSLGLNKSIYKAQTLIKQ